MGCTGCYVPGQYRLLYNKHVQATQPAIGIDTFIGSTVKQTRSWVAQAAKEQTRPGTAQSVLLAHTEGAH
jgi:hypothetical protein